MRIPYQIRIRRWLMAGVVLSILALSFAAWGQRTIIEHPKFKAKVKEVVEGDLLILDYNGQDIEVRLYGIDAPEKIGNQPYWKESKEAAEKYCLGETVEVDITKTNVLKQWIAKVYLPDGKNVSWLMAESGYAWSFNPHYRHEVTIRRLEGLAIRNKRGLWAAAEKPIPPWDWFKQHSRPQKKDGKALKVKKVQNVQKAKPAMKAQPVQKAVEQPLEAPKKAEELNEEKP